MSVGSPPSSPSSSSDAPTGPRWQPLNSRQRRIAGVLVEKAKTVPDSYPMTINGIVNGCNQKSNRDPHMDLSEDDVEQVLQELRGLGVVVEVQTSASRVPKYKHLLYEWLGVDKVEMAVITELLLRGPQTLGDLRARASRMEPIADQGTLHNLLKSLIAKKLVLELTPPGRGQIVTHNLYKDRELPELRARYANHVVSPGGSSDDQDSGPAPSGPAHSTPAHTSAAHSGSSSGGVSGGPASASAGRASSGFTPGVTLDMFAEVRVEVAELRAEVSRLRRELEELRAKWES